MPFSGNTKFGFYERRGILFTRLTNMKALKRIPLRGVVSCEIPLKFEFLLGV
jgi:hypothetical protein